MVQVAPKSVERDEYPVNTVCAPNMHADAWRLRVVSNLLQLHQIRDEWLALERDCIDPHAAFQSYTWCESWAHQFCGDTGAPKLQIFCMYKGDELTAILPMMTASLLGAQTLTLLGEPHSQIANVITRAGVDCSAGLELCLEKLSQHSIADVITIGPIPEGSPLFNVLEKTCVSSDPARHMSLVTWPKIWNKADYVKTLKKNRRKDFGKKLRRLEGKGNVSFTRHDATSDQLENLVKLAVKWKRSWLETNQIISIGLSYQKIASFLSGCKGQSGGFELEVEALNVDQKPIALCINLVGKDVRHCYLSAYDPDYAQTSPGTLIHQHSIQSGVQDGDRAYNFLGFPTPFKDMWANQSVGLMRYQKPLTIRGRIWLRFWVNGLRPVTKSILTSTRSITKHPTIIAMIRRLAISSSLSKKET